MTKHKISVAALAFLAAGGGDLPLAMS